ncbi:MAG: DMT family transporter [Desulfamplus sp.]|nr:DMT family transporter [Desulfamplus sp.]
MIIKPYRIMRYTTFTVRQKTITQSQEAMMQSDAVIKNRSLPGILLLITGGFIFSIQDVIIKFISGSYPVHEIVFFRSLFAVLPVFAIVRLEGGIHLLKTRNIFFQIMRSVVMFMCYTSYYLSIALIPLSHTVTLFFCCPLFITALSVIFLKERIDKKGWAALFLGFLGIVVVMQPGMTTDQQLTEIINNTEVINNFDSYLSTINIGAFLALLSGLFYAITAVCTRKYGVNESGVSLVFYPMMIYLLFSGIIWITIGDGRFATDENKNMAFLLRNWTAPGNKDFFLILVVGCFAAVGTYCLSQAYRLSDASVVAPFEYFAIPISVIWGYLFWQEMPGFIQLIGIFMIVGSGVYVLRRSS